MVACQNRLRRVARKSLVRNVFVDQAQGGVDIGHSHRFDSRAMVSPWNPSRNPGWEERGRLLEEAFKATWTTGCSVAIDGPCQRPIVQGHIIPESRLKAISRNGQVIVAEPRPINIETMDQYADQLTFRSVSTSVATTDFFSCQTDDSGTFQLIEQSEVDWFADDERLMEKLALCAYKAILPSYVRQDRNARMWEHLATMADPARPELMAHNAVMLALKERRQANVTGKVKGLIEEMIRVDDFRHMTHVIIHTGPDPLIAANTFFTTSPFLREDLFEGEVPQFITAYPSKCGQTVIRSWITPDHPSLTFIELDAEKSQSRHLEAQAASALILQESEVIAISPDAWEDYGEARQDSIRDHFHRTAPLAMSPVVPIYQFPEPQLINLFNTTPLVT